MDTLSFGDGAGGAASAPPPPPMPPLPERNETTTAPPTPTPLLAFQTLVTGVEAAVESICCVLQTAMPFAIKATVKEAVVGHTNTVEGKWEAVIAFDVVLNNPAEAQHHAMLAKLARDEREKKVAERCKLAQAEYAASGGFCEACSELVAQFAAKKMFEEEDE